MICAMLMMIDNYDSFTYNLVQYCGQAGAQVSVYRNDAVSVDDIIALSPDGIILSPGPGHPHDAGVCVSLLKTLIATQSDIPVLGVCLGHQALALACGGDITHADQPIHGKTSPVTHTGSGLFAHMPDSFAVTRYHSLIAARASLPDTLTITAQTEDGVIMGLEHTSRPLASVQFHPESIATENGLQIIKNYINNTKC